MFAAVDVMSQDVQVTSLRKRWRNRISWQIFL